jgi:hypothetical protein
MILPHSLETPTVNLENGAIGVRLQTADGSEKMIVVYTDDVPVDVNGRSDKAGSVFLW